MAIPTKRQLRPRAEMNDSSLEDPVNCAGAAVDSAGADLDGIEEEEEKYFLEPSHWWFAKTACPLLAGTFGPMANAFSICALGQHWRQHTPLHGEHVTIQDPAWLYAVNAVSLFAALVANMTLLLNMANRLRFSIAQPITVAGFYTASILLIGCLGASTKKAFHVYPAEEETLTQAFYYAIWAAALYFIIAILMTYTVMGAVMGKYPKEFDLTTSQRTLMLQTITFMVYLLVGALIFSHVERWPYLVAFYWADVTLLTVGFGNSLSPATHLGRSLLIPFTVGGIVAIGLIIGSIRSMLLQQGKIKMLSRIMEKKRNRTEDIPSAWRSRLHKGRRFKVPAHLSERERRRLEFHAMKHLQESVRAKRKWNALVMSLAGGAILWFVGAYCFYRAEYKQGWSYFVSLYFTWVSLITLGYGDFEPQSSAGRAFFVFWSLLAIPTLTVLISDMGDTVVQGVADATNWIGSVTILPGHRGEQRAGLQGLKRNVRRKKKMAGAPPYVNTHRHLHRSDEAVEKEEEVEAELPDDAVDGMESSSVHSMFIHKMLRSRMTDEDEQRADAFTKLRSLTKLQKNLRFYHWLLAKEVHSLTIDARMVPPKKYTYNEWAYLLQLLGHDESNTSKHPHPTIRSKHHHLAGAPELGTIFNHDGSIRSWSWLDFRSPLMSHKEEAEWILHQLVGKMRREMECLALCHDPAYPPVDLEDFHGPPDSDASASFRSSGQASASLQSSGEAEDTPT